MAEARPWRPPWCPRGYQSDLTGLGVVGQAWLVATFWTFFEISKSESRGLNERLPAPRRSGSAYRASHRCHTRARPTPSKRVPDRGNPRTLLPRRAPPAEKERKKAPRLLSVGTPRIGSALSRSPVACRHAHQAGHRRGVQDVPGADRRRLRAPPELHRCVPAPRSPRGHTTPTEKKATAPL